MSGEAQIRYGAKARNREENLRNAAVPPPPFPHHGVGPTGKNMPSCLLMRIWIDADAAPRAMKEIVFRAAKRLEIETVLVANQRLTLPLNNAFVRQVQVRYGADVADRHIAEEAREGDLAITADIPLAAALVERKIVVIDPRGEEYSEENVRQRLSIRDFMESLRDQGVDTGGPKAYGDGDKRAFAATFDRLLTAMRRLDSH